MLWVHPDHPGRGVRLAYCTNLHPGETVPEIRRGLEAITLALRERLAPGKPFGVGLWLPASVVLAEDGGAGLEELARILGSQRLVPFTFNAFPYGGFHRAGLKEGVYEPTWVQPERLEFTLAVARAAARFAAHGLLDDVAYVSVSTHAGAFGAHVPGPAFLHDCARAFARAVVDLAQLELAGVPSIALSLEAEPRSSANDGRELAEFLAVARPRAERMLVECGLGLDAAQARAAVARHLGTCLDCCHSAVEFEEPGLAWRQARHGGRVGKLQYSSALTLRDPRENERGREVLLGLDEPRYLHQVTGRTPGGTLRRVADLPELAEVLRSKRAAGWLGCEEWRCHFHVPVDLESVDGLGTTRAHAEALLDLALDDPASWTDPELHVEIETYTWDVLPTAARGAGDLVDGLEREYRAVFARLAARGWRPE